MANVRVKFKPGALRKLRSEPGVRADLEARGRRVKSTAESGGGRYRMDSRQGASNPQGRWRVSVTTDDFRARRNNARNHVLVGAMDSAR